MLTCLLNSALISSFSLIRLLISSCCFLSSWSNATCSSSSSVVCFSIFSFSCCNVFSLSASWSIFPSRSSCAAFFCTSSACPCEISTPLAIGDCLRPAEGLFPCNSPPLGSRDITGADGAAKPAFDGGIEARIVGKIVTFSWDSDKGADFVRTWRMALGVWKLAALTERTQTWYMFPGARSKISTAVSARFDSPTDGHQSCSAPGMGVCERIEGLPLAPFT